MKPMSVGFQAEVEAAERKADELYQYLILESIPPEKQQPVRLALPCMCTHVSAPHTLR